MDDLDLASPVIAAIALVMSIIFGVLTVQNANKTARIAEDSLAAAKSSAGASERSATASEASATAAERSAAAAEDQASVTRLDWDARAPKFDVLWSTNPGKWIAKNVGGGAAYNVEARSLTEGVDINSTIKNSDAVEVGRQFSIYPKWYGDNSVPAHIQVELSWTRTPNNGVHDEREILIATHNRNLD